MWFGSIFRDQKVLREFPVSLKKYRLLNTGPTFLHKIHLVVLSGNCAPQKEYVQMLVLGPKENSISPSSKRHKGQAALEQIITRKVFSDISLSRLKVFISRPETTSGIRDPSTATSLSWGELLSTDTMLWVDKLWFQEWLARSRTMEAKKKSRVCEHHLETFPELWTWMDWVFVFIMAEGAVRVMSFMPWMVLLSWNQLPGLLRSAALLQFSQL